MVGTLTPSQAREVVRRGRCAACSGRLVMLRDEDGSQTVTCFACGREVATIAAPYALDDRMLSSEDLLDLP